MKILQTICLLLIVTAPICLAQDTHPPTFTDYPAAAETSHPTHKLILASPQSRRYASILREASTHTPDFAGHYILATIGCGASCILTAAINAQDGTLVWLPFTVCCWPMDITEPLEHKLDSRLLIIHGQRNEKGSSGPHFYTLDSTHRRFVPLPTATSH